MKHAAAVTTAPTAPVTTEEFELLFEVNDVHVVPDWNNGPTALGRRGGQFLLGRQRAADDYDMVPVSLESAAKWYVDYGHRTGASTGNVVDLVEAMLARMGGDVPIAFDLPADLARRVQRHAVEMAAERHTSVQEALDTITARALSGFLGTAQES